MTMVPYRCPSCMSVLVIHCGSTTCAWLRCANAGCTWLAVDVEHERHTEFVATT